MPMKNDDEGEIARLQGRVAMLNGKVAALHAQIDGVVRALGPKVLDQYAVGVPLGTVVERLTHEIGVAKDTLAVLKEAHKLEISNLETKLNNRRPHAEGCNWLQRGDAYSCSCMEDHQLVTDLKKHVRDLHHVTEPVVGLVRLDHAGTGLGRMADATLPVFDYSPTLLKRGSK